MSTADSISESELCYDRRLVARLSWNTSTHLGLTARFLLLSDNCGSDKRTGLSFTIAAGPRHRSQFLIRVLWESWQHFTVSDSGLPLSSPLTICRVTVEVEGVAWSAQRFPTAVNLGFVDRSHYYFIQVALQLSSRGWVDPVPDPLIFRKSGRAGNRTRDLWICSQKLWPLDHRGGLLV
jgi:hypothetical protein